MEIKEFITVEEISNLLDCPFIGNNKQQVKGINEIHRVKDGDLTFVDIEKYFKKAFSSKASVILINQSNVSIPDNKSIIISANPFGDFNRLLEYFQPKQSITYHVNTSQFHDVYFGQSISVGKNCHIGAGTEIGHNVVIGNHVRIGKNCIIYPNSTIRDHVFIGDHVMIQSNCTIGGDAFYYKKREIGRERMLSKGRVILHDHVEIGANTTIDKGVTHDTIIGEHTKIDNLVQIGHDTHIGKNCIIAAQTGIAGACTIKDNVTLWGQVGIASGVTIGENAVLLAKTGVMGSLEGNKTYLGMVAKEWRNKWKEISALEKLPTLLDKINQILK